MKKRMKKIWFAMVVAGLVLAGQSGCGGSSDGFLLDVEVTGQGRVVSDPAGIDCGDDCAADFPSGTQVVLTAAAQPGHKFVRWSGGGCQGTEPCTVTLSSDVQVTATFEVLRLVFSADFALDRSDSRNTNEVSNIWTVNADGTGLTPLTQLIADGVSHSDPRWSPDNSRIVFVADRALDGSDAMNMNGVKNIWVMNADGSDPKPLTQWTAVSINVFDPRWSPDGTKVVFSSDADLNGNNAVNANSTRNIWTVDVDGTNLTVLTELTSLNTSATQPSFSPDGNYIVYRSARALNGQDMANTNNVTNIWRMDADGQSSTPLTQLTAFGIFHNSPEWSPDGEKILFSSSRDLNSAINAANPNGTLNVWVMNFDGSGLSPLTALTASDAHSKDAKWSLNGERVVYVSSAALNGEDAANLNTTPNIWVVDQDGENRRPITPYTAVNLDSSYPALSPDGNQVAYVTEGALDGGDTISVNGADNIFVRNLEGTASAPLTMFTADKITVEGIEYSH